LIVFAVCRLSKSYVYEIFSTPLYFTPVTMLSLPNIRVVRFCTSSIFIKISIERKTSFGTLSKLSGTIFSGSASSTLSVVIGTSSIFALFASAATLNAVTAIVQESNIEIILYSFTYLLSIHFFILFGSSRRTEICTQIVSVFIKKHISSSLFASVLV